MFFATWLLPNDVRVTVEQQLPGNLSMEDRQMMKEIIAVNGPRNLVTCGHAIFPTWRDGDQPFW
jgi:hypothetical protein